MTMTRCLIPPQPVGRLACHPILRAWKRPTRQAVIATAAQVDQEPQQSPVQLASDAQQQQQQQRPGLEIEQVQAQTTCQGLWSLLSSQPPGELSAVALGTAFQRAFEMADLKQPEDRAVAEAVGELGWANLEVLSPGQLARLLKLSAWCESCTPERMRAWLAAFEAGNGLGALAPKSRVVLLEAARRLAVPGTCWVPRRVLGSNLGRLCTPASLANHKRLGLRPVARTYSCARDLGFKLTAEQHQVLVNAAVERLQAGEFSIPGLAELMQSWAAMERQFDQREVLAKAAAARAAAAAKQLPPAPKLEQPSRQQRPQQGLERAGGREEAPRKGSSAPLGKIVSGYPGDDALQVVVEQVHARRSEMGPWALGQLLGALGVLRYAPPPHVLRDLLAVLEQGMVGAEQRREVTAALNGLARLGLDPGESFAEGCMRVVVADGGRDQTLVSNVARTLTMLQRCTPEHWQVLVDLLSQGLARSGITTLADLRRNDWRPRLIMWLTAYLLMEEQYGGTALEQGGGTAAQQGEAAAGDAAAAAGAAAAGPAAQRSSGAVAAGGSSSGAAPELAAEQGAGAQGPLPVAQLPTGFLHCCVAEALETRRTAPPAYSQPHRVAAKVVRELAGSTVDLQDCYSILHPATSAPLVVDIALPELRFAVVLNRPRDVVRNTGALLGSVLAAVRLARLCGWELVVVPREVLQPSSTSRSGTAGWDLEEAIRVYLRRHATRLLQRPAADSGAAV